MIYTSRYGNKRLNNEEFYPVGISLGRPKFPIDYRIMEQIYMFAPKKTMWGKSHEEFDALYTEYLEQLGTDKIEGMLNRLRYHAGNKQIVLLCFEDVRDPAQNCHRLAFGKFVREKLGYEVEELDDPSPINFKKSKKVEKKEEPKYNKEDQFRAEQLNLFMI